MEIDVDDYLVKRTSVGFNDKPLKLTKPRLLLLFIALLPALMLVLRRLKHRQ